ncbi:GntR family transcriptional regulator [Saccharopolyspora rhizosphaerae]|uniref:GntR family transcriptional regulator n=1 Tax=Saccharopolyspora rhizosphaerae TaxID=2492662 RepID=A0A426JN05_9PSEU|nr:GntR family transcriptional regulator [Saccharopolyspora rhizosphaerae]RRO14544.1 GntR family transcriptional regulator [Saccharopolyspora rhizosphaerae]
MGKKEQLAEHFRALIRDGKLKPGDRLPATRAIAEEHGVSEPTARAALAWLRAAGQIRTSQRGSFVAEDLGGSSSAQDRLRRAIRTGTTNAETENQQVTAAELIVPPSYISGIYDLEEGDQVVRREYVIRGLDGVVQALHVDWYPATFAIQVPALLSMGERTGGELLAAIEKATGRTVNHGRDAVRGRSADEREARLMEVEVGSSLLAGAHAWSDDAGLLVYGEWCLRADVEVGYEYQIQR